MDNLNTLNALKRHVDYTDVQVINKNNSKPMTDCQLQYSRVLILHHAKTAQHCSTRTISDTSNISFRDVQRNNKHYKQQQNPRNSQRVQSERICDTALPHRNDTFKYDLIIARLSLHYIVTACMASTRVVVPNLDRYESSKEFRIPRAFEHERIHASNANLQNYR